MIAAAGETVTCEGGHPLYRVKRDIMLGSRVMLAANFERVDEAVPEPLFAQPIKPTCPHCGEPWLRAFGLPPGKRQIHVAGEWRP